LGAAKEEFPEGYEYSRRFGHRTTLSVPLVRGDKALGAILLRRNEVRPYDPKHIELVKAFADQAAVAIENLRLSSELKARNAELTETLEQQTATAEILRVISSSPTDIQPVLNAVVRTAAKLCGASDVIIRRVDGDVLRIAAHVGPVPIAQEAVPIRRGSFGGRAVLERRTIHVHDALDPDALAEYPETAQPRLQNAPYRTVLAVPLMRGNVAIGTIAMRRPEMQPFSDREIKLLETFAAQAMIAIENVRLFNDTKEALEQQTATADVLKVISSSPTDIQPVLDAVAKSAARLCGADDVMIRQIDGDSLRLVAHLGPIETVSMLPMSPGSAIGRAVMERRTIHIHDSLDDQACKDFPDAAEIRQQFGIRTMLAAPLLREGIAIGAIGIRRLEVRPFSDREIKLLETFAAQAAIAIENVRLFNETKEALSQQTATADVLKLISRTTFDLQPVLDTLVRSAAELCDAQHALYFRIDADGLRPQAWHNVGEDYIAYRKAHPVPFEPTFVMGRAVLTCKAAHIHDVLAEPGYVGQQAQKLGEMRTALGVPVLREGKPIGGIGIFRKEVRPFTERQIELVTTFADQAAIAIENVRLFNETKEALERQTATSEVLRVISESQTDTQPVFDAIVRSAVRLCGGTFGGMVRIDGETMHLWAHYNYSPDAMKVISLRYPAPISEHSLVGLAVRTRDVVHSPDTLNDPRSKITPFSEAAGFRAQVTVPLVKDGTVLGTLNVLRDTPGPFSEAQIQTLRTFADQAVIAIENVRLFNETKEALERQTVTSEILRVISSSPTDAQPVFDAIVISGRQLFRGMNVSLRVVKGEHAVRVASTSPIDDPVGDTYPATDQSFPGALAMLSRSVVQVADILTEGWVSSQVKRTAERRGWRAVLAAPMLRESNAIGVIAVTRIAPGPFTDKEIALVKTFADQAVIAIENVRMFNETKEALDQQTATAEILRVISSSPTDTGPIFDAIVNSGVNLFDGSTVSLRLVKGDHAEIVASSFPKDIAVGVFAPLRDDGYPSMRAMRQRALVHVPDMLDAEAWVSDDAKRRAAEIGFRAIMSAPMLRENVAIGAIQVFRPNPGPYTDKQIALLKTFADQAVIAIENVRLFKELQAKNADLVESLDRQTATTEILRVISSSPTDIQPVLDAVAASAARLCAADDVVIRRIDGGKTWIAAHVGSIPVQPDGGVRSVALRTIIGTVVREGRTLHIPDVTDPREREKYPDSIYTGRGMWGIRTNLIVPLLRENAVIGAIVMRRCEVRPFSDKQVELLETFAAQAVIAIENVRLFKELQARNSEITEALEQQTATAEILKVISSSPTNVQPVLDAVAEYATRVCDAGDAGVNLIDGTSFRLVAHYGTIPAVTRDEAIPLNRGTVVGRAILERRSIHVPDLFAAEDFPEGRVLGARFGNRTTLAAPLLREGTPIGALLIRRTDVRPFTEKQIKLLETFAAQAVIAIENVRLFNETKEALEQQTATAEILKVISSSPTDVQPVFDAIVKSGARLFRDSSVMLRLVKEDSIEQTARSDSANDGSDVFRVPLGDERFVSPRAIMRREIVHVPDIFAEAWPSERMKERAEQKGWRAILCAPMLREGNPIGTIVVTRPAIGPFTDKEIVLLKTFADQAVIAIENVRLFKELQARNAEITESLEQQTATAEILKVISRSPTDVQPVFDAIVRSGVRLFGSSYASLRLIKGDQTVLAASVPAVDIGGDALDAALSSNRMPSTRAILRHEIVQVPDVLSEGWVDERVKERAKHYGYRAVLSAPMLRDNVPIGAINITRPTAGPFTGKQVALLKTFADQAVIAIENVRLFKELQARNADITEALEQQTATAEILKVISSSPTDTQPVFEAILANATRLCDASVSSLFLYDGEVLVNVAHQNASPAFIEFLKHSRPRPSRETTTRRAALERRTVHVADLLNDPEYSPPEFQRKEGARSVLSVPLMREDTLVGVVTMWRREVRPFTEKQIALVQTFADQAVIAIENVRLFKEIQEKGRQLEIANKHKSEFLANMSHELRTPLNAIIGFSEALIEKMFGEMNAKQEDYLRDIHSSGRHLLSLINDILDLSKIEAGRMELELSEFSLPAALKNALTLVRERAQTHGIALKLHLDSKLSDIRADERKFKQIVLNLLSNAVKFTPDGGRVEVDARANGGSVTVSVKDTGVGIASKDQAALFEEFRQVGRTSAGKREGTGLGLALTRRFVELHGGKIGVESTPGKGSTFTFTLPLNTVASGRRRATRNEKRETRR
jgi:GAF domain-containing protein